ncbi:flagellar basal body rod protein FlgB [Xanthomonas campestris pv. phormiicola]|nr:flagellar basal body rod protein FlgB [Xanthomonas campestris pv. phormiicola]UYC17840.1 flagellar basal body rod protein FlgB [Xanthomonas campestris pv. phormiicola]
MGLDLKQALGVHPDALALRSERAQVLAANLANDSTPGYQARDLDFQARLQQRLGDASEAPLPQFDDDKTLYRVPGRTAMDGNTVELGAEQARFAQNAVDFQTSLTFVNMRLRGLAAAIKGEA